MGTGQEQPAASKARGQMTDMSVRSSVLGMVETNNAESLECWEAEMFGAETVAGVEGRVAAGAAEHALAL